MNDENINGILDVLYETRSRGLESKYIKLNGKTDEIKELEELEKQISDFTQRNIEDKKIQDKLLEMFNKYQEYNLAEMILWNKEYYKKGFLDGISFARELQENRNVF